MIALLSKYQIFLIIPSSLPLIQSDLQKFLKHSDNRLMVPNNDDEKTRKIIRLGDSEFTDRPSNDLHVNYCTFGSHIWNIVGYDYSRIRL